MKIINLYKIASDLYFSSESNSKTELHCKTYCENNNYPDTMIDRHLANILATYGKEALEESFSRVTNIKTYKKKSKKVV